MSVGDIIDFTARKKKAILIDGVKRQCVRPLFSAPNTARLSLRWPPRSFCIELAINKLKIRRNQYVILFDERLKSEKVFCILRLRLETGRNEVHAQGLQRRDVIAGNLLKSTEHRFPIKQASTDSHAPSHIWHHDAKLLRSAGTSCHAIARPSCYNNAK